jgi:hypothetical protein
VSYSISGSAVTYAKGGGAYDTTAGAALSGAANTGNGGNGNSNANSGSPSDWNGGAGGSGVVIIRYPDTYSAAKSTTGSPTITVSGGYRVYKFTQSGSITF